MLLQHLLRPLSYTTLFKLVYHYFCLETGRRQYEEIGEGQIEINFMFFFELLIRL
jgi:hypothetical protein